MKNGASKMSKKIEKNTEEFNQTEAGSIWNELKDKQIEMFTLPNQKVSDYCEPFNVEPSKLYLTARSMAVYPALEAACGDRFVVSLVDRFISVARAPESIFKNK